MFGGQGIFVDGLMIALIARDVIYLKADAETIPAFEQEGLAPFSYATKNGEHTLDVLLAHAGPSLRRHRGTGALGARRACGGCAQLTQTEAGRARRK